jgi:hypothetical protein
MRAAAFVAETATLMQVRLKKSEAVLLAEPLFRTGKLRADVSFDMVDYQAHEQGLLSVEVALKLHVRYHKKANTPQEVTDVAHIMVWLVADYQTPRGPIPEEIRSQAIPAFAKYNAVFNCWPYFRVELQHLTSMMGLPSFVLGPLIIRQENSEKRALPQKPKGRAHPRRAGRRKQASVE